MQGLKLVPTFHEVPVGKESLADKEAPLGALDQEAVGAGMPALESGDTSLKRCTHLA